MLKDLNEEWCYQQTIQAHNSEVTCLSWNENLLATGGRDRFVHIIDIQQHLENSGSVSSAAHPLDLHTAQERFRN